MAVYSTFFLCEPERLPEGFPGWKLPLAEPVERQIVHPLTRERITIRTREPEWEDYDPNDFQMPEYHGVSIEGDYQTYLEERLPPFVQKQDHWCTKRLTSVELDPLVAVVVDTNEPSLDFPLYSPPPFLSALQVFPKRFVEILETADDAAIRAIADRWAGEMSTPKFTHSVSGQRIHDDWTIEEARNVLDPIVALIKKRHPNEILYLLIET